MSPFSAPKPLGQIFVVSGPSGVGKGTLCQKLRQGLPNLALSTSATTREMRSGEVDGEDYFFLTRAAFEAMIQKNQMLEWAKYNDCYYGTPKPAVEDQLGHGVDVLLEIETQGALQVREVFKDSPIQPCLIFLMPPSLKALKDRLVLRQTNTADDIDARLKIAEAEMAVSAQFDYVVVNDELARCYRTLAKIIEKCRNALINQYSGGSS